MRWIKCLVLMCCAVVFTSSVHAGDCKTLYSKHIVDFRYNTPEGLARAYVRVVLDQWPGNGSLSVVDGAQVTVNYGNLSMSGQVRTVHYASNGVIRASWSHRQISFEWTAFSAAALSPPFQRYTHQLDVRLPLSITITGTDGSSRTYEQIKFDHPHAGAPRGKVPLQNYVQRTWPDGNTKTSIAIINGTYRLALPYLQPQ